MDTKDFHERWPEMKELIKTAHPNVKEEDLQVEFGKEVELLEKLQMKLGKTKAEIYEWLSIMG
ncbi:MAG: general stress protein CsbD [Chitinophagales bacterium]|nr:general stress protein CsbD [Chitinophagaceae bacterium]MCB9064533.1 general stress protein CsbD [Chitinophagales bacterium]